MAKALAKPPRPMTVEQFVDGAMAQPGGRYELLDGEVVAMVPEGAAQRTPQSTDLARARGCDRGTGRRLCEALPDGMTVNIDARTAYEPDARSTAASGCRTRR